MMNSSGPTGILQNLRLREGRESTHCIRAICSIAGGDACIMSTNTGMDVTFPTHYPTLQPGTCVGTTHARRLAIPDRCSYRFFHYYFIYFCDFFCKTSENPLYAYEVCGASHDGTRDRYACDR